MSIEILLLDLDDTILDFHWSERRALTRTLEALGISADDDTLSRYSRINNACWKLLEQGKMTRSELMERRFERLFQELGLTSGHTAAAALYPELLAQGHCFLPGAEEALERLSKKYRLFLVSNGNASVQTGRLDSSGIRPYFEDIFISEELGADKPAVEFFERCFGHIGKIDKAKTLIVGDSLTSDIRGGNNTGIATCWVNPRHLPRPADLRIDYEIEALAQLEALLETI